MHGFTAPAGLTHAVMFYRGDQGFLDGVLPFIRDGVERREPVMVAVPSRNLEMLRDGLGDAAAHVDLADMSDVGRNPARTFALFGRALGAEGGDRRMRVVAEPIWPGRAPEEYPACVQNEALFNDAFAEFNVTTLCPYDDIGLPRDVLADARRTHPLIQRNGCMLPSAEFDWKHAFSDYNEPLVADPAEVTLALREFDDLGSARSFAAGHARAFGATPECVADLQLIVTELATNSLKYTGGDCVLALWKHGAQLVCEVRDHGHLDDPLAGRRPAAADSPGGRGLLLVNAISDLVRMHTSRDGTTIRAYLSLNRGEESQS